ncbi:hypothetical protein ACSBR2_009306 [Camellia fascicularis]
MGTHFILVAIDIMALASTLASTSDPSQLQDFCVAIQDSKSAGLNTLGISLARIDFAPYGLNPSHTHPRETEILVVLEGTLYVGFVTSNTDNRLFTKVLYPGDVFVFPQVHKSESFHHEQDSVLWSEKLRPCAEALYIVLFENHSQLLGPVVVSILQEAMNGCPTSVTEITPGLLLKDAAYGAAAYVYYELSNYLSFKEWCVLFCVFVSGSYAFVCLMQLGNYLLLGI